MAGKHHSERTMRSDEHALYRRFRDVDVIYAEWPDGTRELVSGRAAAQQANGARTEPVRVESKSDVDDLRKFIVSIGRPDDYIAPPDAKGQTP